MRLHHLNITCKNREAAKLKLVNLYGFKDYGIITRKFDKDYRSVLKQNGIYFTIKESDDVSCDTIDDIAFCVDSVKECCDCARENSAVVVEEPHIVDCRGIKRQTNGLYLQTQCNCPTNYCTNFIERAVLKSPVGNLTHTLLDKSNFSGEFLPKFTSNSYSTETSYLGSIDHIALAVPCNSAMQYMNWYSNCLNLLRFEINKKESASGLIIRAKRGNGLRLLTLVEHPCSVNALSTKEVEARNGQVKFVFCESLVDQGNDQIQTFLRSHKGAGVQHVAFHTTQIQADTQSWLDRGVPFIKPPEMYYKEIEKTLDNLRSKFHAEDISNKGILIDAEKLDEKEDGNSGYLYQVFTNPIFDSNTFFFELIQRDNARGFGAGNITALWKALEAHLQSTGHSMEDTVSQLLPTNMENS